MLIAAICDILAEFACKKWGFGTIKVWKFVDSLSELHSQIKPPWSKLKVLTAFTTRRRESEDYFCVLEGATPVPILSHVTVRSTQLQDFSKKRSEARLMHFVDSFPRGFCPHRSSFHPAFYAFGLTLFGTCSPYICPHHGGLSSAGFETPSLIFFEVRLLRPQEDKLNPEDFATLWACPHR